jgi:hypothetical protein
MEILRKNIFQLKSSCGLSGDNGIIANGKTAPMFTG